MRRHPLIARPALLLGGALVILVIAGAGVRVATSTPGATITSATGETLGFEPAETTIRAGVPITITFMNRSSLPHNLVFTGGMSLATRTIVEPGTSDQVLAPTTAGTYPFACTIHEGMTGRLIVAR